MSSAAGSAESAAAVALEIEHLVVRYGSRKAVDDVSISVRAGELVAVVGESGCGKTSTATAAVGLIKAAEGAIRVAAQDLVSARGRSRRDLLARIQLICQDPYEALDPRFTVEAVVAEPLLVHNVGGNARQRRAMVVAALERAGITDADTFLRRYPHELSGGQLQRVAIASAIILDPLVLVADEPVSMLDVSLRAGVLNLFAGLRDSGIAILMITHDLVTAAQYADRVIVMYAGRVVEQGHPDVVLAAPQHPYTQALLAAVPRPGRSQALRDILPGSPPNLLDLPSGCRFQPRCCVAVDACSTIDPPLETPPGSAHPDTHLVACIRADTTDRSRRHPPRAGEAPPSVPVPPNAGTEVAPTRAGQHDDRR